MTAIQHTVPIIVLRQQWQTSACIEADGTLLVNQLDPESPCGEIILVINKDQVRDFIREISALAKEAGALD